MFFSFYFCWPINIIVLVRLSSALFLVGFLRLTELEVKLAMYWEWCGFDNFAIHLTRPLQHRLSASWDKSEVENLKSCVTSAKNGLIVLGPCVINSVPFNVTLSRVVAVNPKVLLVLSCEHGWNTEYRN
jgi:hypothetical protein